MTVTVPRLRIFLSSPGDVGAERAVAVAVTERLQLEFRGQVQLEAYLWERSVLRATDTFQAQIIDIRDVDLAIFILWSRFGTPLPVEQFARPDGTAYLSGTEYEFERARDSYEAKASPEILCYLKTAEVRLSLKDREERARRNAELDAVGAFVDHWFRNPDGTFRSAFYSFEKSAQFEELIELHVREWVRGRLHALQGGAGHRTDWQGSPFRGLKTFDFEHSLIYCGRTQLVAEALDALRRRAAEGHPFLMVTGMSGVGKSSLVRAGILPLLTRPSVIEGVIGWRRAAFRPNVSHQNLLDSFAAALAEDAALPKLARPGRGRDVLVDPASLASAVLVALDEAAAAARDALPDPDEGGSVRLVLVVDQFEEIFDETVSERDRTVFVEILRTLILTGRVWIIATLRADFFSRTAELPERFRDLFVERGGLFTVGGPRSTEIGQMITRPAAMAGLEFERRPDTGQSLDDVLRDEASGNPTVLPLLEFTLDELWRRSAGSGVLRFADYEEIGGLHGALRIRADEEFGKLPAEVQASLPQVLAAIVHTDPSDDRMILQNRVATAQFDGSPRCRRLIQAFVDAHLLVGDRSSDGEAVIALAHEALLREWPPAISWIETNREFLRLRAGISAAAALWRTSGCRDSRLLSGELLEDAIRLLRTDGTALGPEERLFVTASRRADRRQRNRYLRRAALAAAIVVLTVAATALGTDALSFGARVVEAAPRVWRAEAVMPVRGKVRANLRASIDALVPALRADLATHKDLGAWSVAQMGVAVHGIPPFDPDAGPELRRRMSETKDPTCQCWRESSSRSWNFMATAWVLSALAFYDQAATPAEIAALLGRQNADGWWPIVPAAPEPRNASTVVTALTVLALQRHLDRKLVPDDQVGAVQAAVARGVTWLHGMSVAGTARWSPYPPQPVGIFDQGDYVASSALTLHVLRSVVGTSSYDGSWLDLLPREVPNLRLLESPKAYLMISERDYEIDDSRMYRFPWMLLATVEAYPSGSVLQRARALLWVERALSRPLQPRDFASEPWVIGEVVHTLRLAEAHLEGRPGNYDRTNAAARVTDLRPAD